MPPAPKQHFNDYAGITSAATRDKLTRKLEEFEKATSSQVVVAVFPKMQSDSSLEDYVHRMFQAWRIGQARNKNGVLLAVFTQDRRIRIEVGYGLEGALPDATAKRIIENEITPHFKRGNYDAGLVAGVNAILAATRGEYRAGARAHRTGSDHWVRRWIFNRFFPWNFLVVAIGMNVLWTLAFGRRRRRGTVYDRRGRRRYSSGWDWGGGRSSGGGGGWSSGGGGGFSGGGGSSGGGGASGSW